MPANKTMKLKVTFPPTAGHLNLEGATMAVMDDEIQPLRELEGVIPRSSARLGGVGH